MRKQLFTEPGSTQTDHDIQRKLMGWGVFSGRVHICRAAGSSCSPQCHSTQASSWGQRQVLATSSLARGLLGTLVPALSLVHTTGSDLKRRSVLQPQSVDHSAAVYRFASVSVPFF